MVIDEFMIFLTVSAVVVGAFLVLSFSAYRLGVHKMHLQITAAEARKKKKKIESTPPVEVG
ncbi:MAG: hypothetical protein WC975_05820 [Phycisphaerae bacterium]